MRALISGVVRSVGSTAVSGDGVDVLVADHRRCEALFRALGEDTALKDASKVAQVVRLLSVHDALESRYLYPFVEDRLPDGLVLATEGVGDHHEIAGCLAEIDRRRPGDAYRDELLVKVIELVRAHVAEEERVLFPQLRRHLAPAELARFGDDLRAARDTSPTRPHPHAPRFSVGTRSAAATLRRVDRLRDALRRRP